MGILILFLVGGNDTTRNSMSGGLLGLSRFPEQFQKLREHPDLVPSAISEFVRCRPHAPHSAGGRRGAGRSRPATRW